MTHDHLPRILKIGPGAICIFGYNGRGIAPGTVFGKAAARYVITGDEAALPITPAAVARELFPALKRQTYEIAALAVHAASNRIR